MSERGDVLELPYGIDFDGVLARQIWPDRGIGEPIEDNVKKLAEVAMAGFETVIHTARPWSDYRALEAWLKHHRIPYDGIIMGKFLAHKYVDDKAINSEEESWLR